MNGLRSNVIESHKEKYLNNSSIDMYNDKDKNRLVFYTLDELRGIKSDWFPLCCYINEDDRLIFGGNEKVLHTYIEGETGCGKTTRIIMQSLRALATMKNKHSFIVVDPFGEIYENSYSYLKDLGYNMRVLNCDNPHKSDTYNPLYLLAKDTYDNQRISIETHNQLKQIALTIEPINYSSDPSWSQGACGYFNGVMLDMFEELADRKIEPHQVNLYNVIQRHFCIREKVSSTYERNIRVIPYFAKKDRSSLSIQKIVSVTNNAEKTRDSYFGVLENNLDKFNEMGMFKLSSNSTINVNELIEKPTVIFVQSGTSTVGDALVSLLVNDTYNAVVRYGKNHKNKKLPRNIHCFLDEFANCDFGEGKDFIKMLTTSRKFGMYWHMYLQCDAQLDKKFSSVEIGNIIRANSTEIFMGSQDYKTIERFSVSCGERAVESLNSRLFQKEMSFENVRLINIDKLQKIPEGHVYIKVNKENILYSYYEAFYKCKEFNGNNLDLFEMYPNNDFDYKTTLCVPIDIEDVEEPEEDEKEKFENMFSDFLKDRLKWVTTKSGLNILAVDYSHDELDMILSSNYVSNCYYNETDLKIYYEVKEKEEEDEYQRHTKILDEFIREKINELGIKEYLDSLNEFTCMPNCLIERHMYLNNESYIETGTILKFNIIETYIKNNDFKDERNFHKDIEKEVKKIKDLNLVPEIILESFENAKKEINELSLENYKEIKKIILKDE